MTTVSTTYQMRKDLINKKILVTVGSKMNIEMAEKFVREYQMIVRSVKANEYTLEIDCTGMKVLTPELAQSLEECLKLYKEAGFKKIICIIQNDIVVKMQLSRLIRNTGLTNTEIVNSYI